MTVQSIMVTNFDTMSPRDKVSDALRMLHEKHVRTLVVVNDDGTFAGLFNVRQVVHLLLPKVAQIPSGLTDLSFMPDDLGEMYHRLRAVGDRPVVDFLENPDDLLMCSPETALPEVLELLHLCVKTSLPLLVVDEKSNKLVGMVSSWTVLERLVMNVFSDEDAARS